MTRRAWQLAFAAAALAFVLALLLVPGAVGRGGR
jgi:hypothetical protein